MPETCPLNLPMIKPMYAPCDSSGFSLMIFWASSFRLMSDFCVASFRDLPSESFCIIVLIWFSEIVLFSRISSSLSIFISGFGW